MVRLAKAKNTIQRLSSEFFFTSDFLSFSGEIIICAQLGTPPRNLVVKLDAPTQQLPPWLERNYQHLRFNIV